MCKNASADAYSRSRRRWYEFPAGFFFHRPVRCRYCSERHFALKNDRGRSYLPRLWMHYALMLMLIGAGLVAAEAFTEFKPLTAARLEAIEFIRSLKKPDATNTAPQSLGSRTLLSAGNLEL